jgi:hypothetical protein
MRHGLGVAQPPADFSPRDAVTTLPATKPERDFAFAISQEKKPAHQVKGEEWTALPQAGLSLPITRKCSEP